MIVGEMPIVAIAKSTSSPATEFRAIDAFENKAANVRTKGYEKDRESMGRKTSEEVKRRIRGSVEMIAATADIKFCHQSARRTSRIGASYV